MFHSRKQLRFPSIVAHRHYAGTGLTSMLRLPRRLGVRTSDFIRERQNTLLERLGIITGSQRHLVSARPHGSVLLSQHLEVKKRECSRSECQSSAFSVRCRALSTTGGGKNGGQAPRSDGDVEGVFDRLRQSFQNELEKNPGLKERISKIREAEKKLGSDVADRVKTMQGEVNKYASSAAERAQEAGGVLRERMEGVRQTFKDNLDRARGVRSEEKGKGDHAGAGETDAENEFVRASKEKFSGARKALDENSFVVRTRAYLEGLREGLANASAELFRPRERGSAVVKKLRQPKKPKAAAAAAGAEEAGGTEGQAQGGKEEKKEEEQEEEENRGGIGGLMIVKSAGEAWKRLQERLKDAPIIQDLLGASRVVAAGGVGRSAKAARDAVKDRIEDAQEAWETSQHPMVYRVSSAWDSMTAENEIGVGVRELRRLDPGFNLEDWKVDIQEEFLPQFMSAFLRGDTATLESWTSEACFNKLSTEIRQRKADGIVLDPHVLDIRQGDVVTIKADAGRGNPTVAYQFMCQQINCVRNTKGEVVEGSEDDIRATYYMLAFEREFLEEESELRWKVVDMMVIGAFPWY